jgi:tetratricopeptide (TPR) repeat protein
MLYLKTKPKAHSAETHRALEAADGYLYLGMPSEALEEFGVISELERQNAQVMLAEIRVLLHMKAWKHAEKLSARGANLHPDEDEFTVQRVFALHQLEKGEEAFRVLLSAPEWIRRTGILHYNLACYEARLGDLNTARRCIDAAIEINSAIKKNARTDPDLAALWN